LKVVVNDLVVTRGERVKVVLSRKGNMESLGDGCVGLIGKEKE